MIKKEITDVFFDLDHTLWDFEKNSALTFKKILVENNIAVELNDFLEVYVPTNHQFWKLYREDKITKEQLRYQRLKSVFDALKLVVSDERIHKLSEEYIQYLSSFNYLFPHSIEILSYLKSKYRLHIITNGFHKVQKEKLSNAGIDMYFDLVIDSEMAGVKKPNPKIFNLAINSAKVQANQAIMIGDSLEADILGAKNVGMHALHFNTHSEELHDICPIIDDLSEIKMFL